MIYWIHNKNMDTYNLNQFDSELVYVFDKNVTIDPTLLLEKAIEKLKDFTEKDFLVISGNIIPNICAVLVAATKTDNIRLLIFNPKLNKYVLYFLDLTVLKKEINNVNQQICSQTETQGT